MADQTYNGWTNYETWATALWIGNEQGSYNYARELAEENRNDVYAVADALQEWIEEDTPDLGAILYSDLLTAALSEVNWREIAEHYIEDLDPEEDEDED